MIRWAAAAVLVLGLVPPARAELTEPQFRETIDLLQSLFAPAAAARGRVLTVVGLWDAQGTAAIADGNGTFTVTVAGGMARQPAATQDALALAVCHEVGHLLGGAPRMRHPIFSWVATEGQADYFATRKCARVVFSDARASAFTRAPVDDPFVVQACRAAHPAADDRARCVRGAMAGRSLASIIAVYWSVADAVRFETPDASVVDSTLDLYPSLQCRLDTFLQGALDADRPRCWFSPDAPAAALPPMPAPPSPGVVLQFLKSGPWTEARTSGIMGP